MLGDNHFLYVLTLPIICDTIDKLHPNGYHSTTSETVDIKRYDLLAAVNTISTKGNMPYYKKSRPQAGGQNKHGRANNSRARSSAPYQNRRRSGGSKRHQDSQINPSKFISRATGSSATPAYQAKHQFADFPFCEELQENISRKNYQTPSAIQDQAILPIMEGKDIIGLANTGTGKTAAFLLPIINKLYADKKVFSVLIFAPTRELAQQIDDQFRVFAANMGLFSTLLVGGANIERQISQLKRKPHVIIATPGRAMDLIKRKQLSIGSVNTLVLDEADRMLDMGFIGDIRTVVQLIPKTRQTLFFSATITPRVQQITEEFLNNPATISVRTADSSENVDQDIVQANTKEEKMEKLLNMLSDEEFEKVLLFGKTKFGVQRLSEHLTKKGFSSVAIHGNKSQSQRQKALKSFKDNRARVLVATDVAARGLDIPNVSHVINFDQPATYEDYIHRIGRTGRGGAKGKAFTFVEKRLNIS